LMASQLEEARLAPEKVWRAVKSLLNLTVAQAL
jgi:hypothetical protein